MTTNEVPQTITLTNVRDWGFLHTGTSVEHMIIWDVTTRVFTVLHDRAVRITDVMFSTDGTIYVGTVLQTRKHTDFKRQGYMWTNLDSIDSMTAGLVRQTVATEVPSRPTVTIDIDVSNAERKLESFRDRILASEASEAPAVPVLPASVLPLKDDPNDSWQRAMRSLGAEEFRAARQANAVRAQQETGPDLTYYLRRLAWFDVVIAERTPPTDPPASPAAIDIHCAAFATCPRPAVGWINHPVIGVYASCRECARILGQTLGELCAPHKDWFAFPFDQAAYTTPCDGTPSQQAACPECLADHVANCQDCQREAARAENFPEFYVMNTPKPPKPEPRKIYEIAREIYALWTSVNYAAKPYLSAMRSLATASDRFGDDDAKSVVLYFLSNATTWRGPDARRIKAELKSIFGLK